MAEPHDKASNKGDQKQGDDVHYEVAINIEWHEAFPLQGTTTSGRLNLSCAVATRA